MKTFLIKQIIRILPIIFLVGCQQYAEKVEVNSPNGDVKISFSVQKGVPCYSVDKTDKPVVLPSKLGFKMGNMADLNQNFIITKVEHDSLNETWEQPWGEKRFITNHYNEVKIYLQEKRNQKRKLNLIFRVFDDGVGFRYQIPDQNNIDSIVIIDEETEFEMPAIEHAWWIPSAYKNNSFYEDLYQYTTIDMMDTVHTPLTLETNSGLYLSIHEANLTDYAAMTIFCEDSTRMKAHLMPWSDGVAVYSKTPMETPWRTIRIAESPGDLITSYLELNLNEPCKIDDVSWIKPCKYIGIWWGMHQGIYTWGSGLKHGATTSNVMNYINFAAENEFDGVLVEGWNEGWDADWEKNADAISFTTPYPDFDIKKIVDYASSKGVKIIGHHETGAAVANYESQMDSAFSFYNYYGIDQVKTGYVGRKMNQKEWHDGQFGVRHYSKVIETAAEHRVMIDVHEPVKQTGLRRTWPNLMAQEGARGQEYNATWAPGNGNPPEHTTILPFTRLLAGPMDFTPGVFNFDSKPGHARIQTTLAKQLALYIVLYSPMQMACDLPENYKNNKGLDFIKTVAVDWETTKVLNAKIGDYITIARKDRNSDDWFIGSITDENSREMNVTLSFLDEGQEYLAQIYADGSNADWKTNPKDLKYHEITVTKNSELKINLVASGGHAMRLTKLKKEN